MSAGVRMVVAVGALLLYLGLRLMALLRVDHELLAWLVGGGQAEGEWVPVPMMTAKSKTGFPPAPE